MGLFSKDDDKKLLQYYDSHIEKVIRRTRMGCLVQPYKPRQSYMLEQNTGSYDSVYHKYIEYVGFKIPYNGTLCYATYNREYDFLRRALPDYAIEEAKHNEIRFMTNDIDIRGITEFKPAQTELISAIDRSISTKKERVWFIHLQTAGGKTLLATYYATKFSMKTMVMCFSDSILHQWEKVFQQYTTIDPLKLVRLNGSLMNEILAGKILSTQYDVYFATPTLIDRWANSRADYMKVTDFFNKAGIGFLIYDEAHRNVSSIVRLTSVVNPRYQMYLSADFGQGGYNKEMQFKSIFKMVPILAPTQQLQRTMKYTKVVVVEYNTYPSTIEKEEPFNRYGYDGTSFMRYEFKKGILQNVILHIIKTFLNVELHHRMLILFMNVEHVEIVYQDLSKRFPTYKIGRYYADLSQEEKDDVKDNADIIVATYGSFSTGLDTHDIKYVLSCNQCNKVQDNQAAGRSRPLPDGSDSVYFLLVDMGFPYCRSKLKTRLFYLQQTKSKDDCAYHYIYNRVMHANDFVEDYVIEGAARAEEMAKKRAEEEALQLAAKEAKKKKVRSDTE